MTHLQFLASLNAAQLAAYKRAIHAANPGTVRSDRKAAAARKNGKLGGRPRGLASPPRKNSKAGGLPNCKIRPV